MPSFWSAVPNSPLNSRRSNWTPCASGVSNAAFTISLFASTASGAIAAIDAALNRPGAFDFGDRAFVPVVREEAKAMIADRDT